jgi:hypothetical protein
MVHFYKEVALIEQLPAVSKNVCLGNRLVKPVYQLNEVFHAVGAALKSLAKLLQVF